MYTYVYVYVYKYIYYKFKSLVFDVIGLINFSRLVNKKKIKIIKLQNACAYVRILL